MNGSTSALIIGLTNFIMIVGLIIKFWVVPIMQAKKKKNAPQTGFFQAQNNPNSKPGKGEVCGENIKILIRHEETLKNLYKEIEEEKAETRTFRERVRQDFQLVFGKIDKINEKI